MNASATGATNQSSAAPPGKFISTPKRMSARPYLGRVIRLLGQYKLLTASTMLLSLLVTLFPFIVSIAFAAIFQILGPIAGLGQASTNNIWERTAPLFGKADAS